MKKRMRIVIPAVLLLGAAAWWFFGRGGAFLYSGTVEATEIDLSARLSAVIDAYGAEEGDAIKVNQTLVRLDCDDIRLAADIARKDFLRSQELFKTGSVSQENYDRLKYKKDDTELKVSWCTVRSPINGRMLYKYREAGEMVGSGTKLATVADLSSVYAYFYVPQPLLAKISLGQEIRAFLPEAGMKEFSGKVEHINDEAEFTPRNVQTRDERTRLVYGIKVRFRNPDGQLKPGMTLEAEFPSK